jgi:hypothetical protein
MHMYSERCSSTQWTLNTWNMILKSLWNDHCRSRHVEHDLHRSSPEKRLQKLSVFYPFILTNTFSLSHLTINSIVTSVFIMHHDRNKSTVPPTGNTHFERARKKPLSHSQYIIRYFRYPTNIYVEPVISRPNFEARCWFRTESFPNAGHFIPIYVQYRTGSKNNLFSSSIGSIRTLVLWKTKSETCAHMRVTDAPAYHSILDSNYIQYEGCLIRVFRKCLLHSVLVDLLIYNWFGVEGSWFSIVLRDSVERELSIYIHIVYHVLFNEIQIY